MAGCTRGGRSPDWDAQTYGEPTPPGSGQTGPGMAPRANPINGPKDSSGVAQTDGHDGISGPGQHQEHNKLPGNIDRP